MKHVFQFLVLTLLVSCYTSTSRVAYRNPYAKEERKTIHAELNAYSFHNDSARIYFHIKGSELQYQRKSPESPFTARLQFRYQVFQKKDGDYNSVDSGTIYVKDEKWKKIPESFNGYFKVWSKVGSAYKIRLSVTDLLSRGKCDVTHYYDIGSLNAPAFFLNMPKGPMPSFQPKTVGDSVHVLAERFSNSDIVIRYYNRNFGTAPPPFANGKLNTFTYRADSIFRYTVANDGSIRFRNAGNGFYHLQVDTTNRNGYTLFCLPDGYPQVKTSRQMLEPLMFICSRDEYTYLTQQTNTRKAVESFWLERTSSRERARHLIQQFYQRVEDANREFTSYIEGWRTDRGMIYLIFGKPGYIQVTSIGEMWTYRTGLSGESIHFTFRKVNNPFSDNDFSLDRNITYKPVWYNALENWRAGRVFKLNQF